VSLNLGLRDFYNQKKEKTMKMIKKYTNAASYGLTAVVFSLVGKSAFATDLLKTSLEGDIKDSLGSQATFWKLFTLAAVVLATGASVSTKNPMVFVGVMGVAFVPAFLIKAFVF
jgi:ABC-type Fe3+-siderophore transport system permease subunit